MKNKLCIALIACLVFVTAGSSMCFADTASAATTTTTSAATSTATPAAITPTAPINLSIEDAEKQLATSIQMQMIQIQNLGDKAAAQGSIEGLQSIKEAERDLKALENSPYGSTADGSEAIMALSKAVYATSKKEVQAMRKFATSIVEPNDTARKNALKLNTYNMYFGLKNMETQYKIVKESADISATVYKQAQLKYNLGVISKVDLLKSQTEYNTAQENLTAVTDGLATYRMNFNIFFGYALDQKVNLTTEITETALPTMTQEAAVKSALENRLEIKEAAYDLEMAELNMGEYRAYGRTTSKYLGAQAKLLGAQAANNMAPDQVKINVITAYNTMMQNYQLVQNGKIEVANSKELSRLVQLQYDNGLCTLTTLQQAQLGYTNAQLDYAKALLNCKIAVEEYNICSGVGKTAATL